MLMALDVCRVRGIKDEEEIFNKCYFCKYNIINEGKMRLQ